jgi:mono/diheme cytochrome c family protein
MQTAPPIPRPPSGRRPRASLRRGLRVLVAASFASLVGCSGAGSVARTSTGAAVAPAAAELDLPPGEGADLVAKACTGCHDLGGLWAYQGYYDAPRWRGLVATMVSHGADLDASEQATVVDYLVAHFGPGTRGQR